MADKPGKIDDPRDVYAAELLHVNRDLTAERAEQYASLIVAAEAREDYTEFYRLILEACYGQPTAVKAA
jgi:hypothetical protein